MKEIFRSIIKTLIYADIFDYCLSSEELYRFLITDEALSFSSFRKILTQINADSFDFATHRLVHGFAQDKFRWIDVDRGYFFLKGRKKIVKIREERKKWSQGKIRKAYRVGGWLKLIPWIKMVGITGALAMENSDENDDIDLMIITGKNRLWLTRFFLILLTEIAGVRRRPQDKSARQLAGWRDKICLNMFLDEENLAVPNKERNLYTAHEVCQVKLIWDKDNTFKKFLWENKWVKKFLPNAIKFKVQSVKCKVIVKSSKFSFFDFLEKNAYKFQLVYMKPRRTIEKIEEGRVLFHPRDCSGWVVREYCKKCEELLIVNS